MKLKNINVEGVKRCLKAFVCISDANHDIYPRKSKGGVILTLQFFRSQITFFLDLSVPPSSKQLSFYLFTTIQCSFHVYNHIILEFRGLVTLKIGDIWVFRKNKKKAKIEELTFSEFFSHEQLQTTLLLFLVDFGGEIIKCSFFQK